MRGARILVGQAASSTSPWVGLTQYRRAAMQMQRVCCRAHRTAAALHVGGVEPPESIRPTRHRGSERNELASLEA